MGKRTANKQAVKKSNKETNIQKADATPERQDSEVTNFLRQNKSKIFTLLFFLFLFAFGLFFLPRVNGNFDENTEQNILLSNIKDYTEALRLDEITAAIHNQHILAISVDPNRDHGIAPYYSFAPILAFKSKLPHTVSVLWHFHTYCLAFTGVIFFYLILRYLFKSKKLSMLMTALYYFTPRIFIDSFHNNKDIVFMALLVAMIYFGIRFIKEKRFRWALLFAFFGGFVCNIKILGLFFVGVIGLGYIVYLTIKKEWSKHNFLCGLMAALLVICWYLALTPAIWGNGFKLIEYIQYCLGNAVNFDVNTAVMFEGVIHRRSDNPLPWYDVPKLILVTLPLFVTAMFVISSVFVIVDFAKNIKHKKPDFTNFAFVILLIMFLVPFLFAILSKPNLYNGWRHFYFMYSLMLIIGSYGVFRLRDYQKTSLKKVNLAITALICLTVVGDVFCLLKYGIANTAYYNILLNTKNLAGVYELDYYNASSQDALRSFISSGKLEENEDGLLYLYASGFGEVVINDMKTYISPDLSNRIVVLNNDTYKKYLKQGKIVYNMSNPVYRYNSVSDYELVYSYKMFNSEVINFYKMS